MWWRTVLAKRQFMTSGKLLLEQPASSPTSPPPPPIVQALNDVMHRVDAAYQHRGNEPPFPQGMELRCSF